MMHIFSIKSALAAPCSFSIGIPLPKGEYSANGGFSLYIGKQIIECHTKVISLWTDRSVRWLLVEGVLPATAEANTQVMLSKSNYSGLKIKPKWVVDSGNSIDIHMRDHSISVSKLAFLELSSLPSIEQIKAHVEFDKGNLRFKTLNIEYEAYYDDANKPLFCEISQRANCIIEYDQDENQASKALNLIAKYRCYFALNKVDLQLKVHNPQPQVHHGGKWDLGNENSLIITEFSLKHATATTPVQSEGAFFSPTQASDMRACIETQQRVDSLQLIQHSSGGEAWNSPNHKLADNQVHLRKRGATCIVDGLESDILRPEPSMSLISENTRLLILPKHFWEKFPTSIISNKHRAGLYFNEVGADKPIELQPGEIKSHDVSYVFSSVKNFDNVLLASPDLVIAPELIGQSQVLPWFDVSCKNDKLQNLVDQGLLSEQNFFAKREALDEFGWRNFGDIYADHEAQNQLTSEPFVSHYNNQYDPLYGFLKQWLVSGDMQWKILADDLFDHLVHIDLYHTELDKPEYNSGLFWHTDHYVQAQTATHRTYSKHQQADVYIDHAGGGGPGAHHCYTTGLALYYWLTGNKDAYTSMMGMMGWMSNIYEGDQTLLGLFLRVKNANYVKLPFTDKLLLGSGTGVLRNVFTNKYPLDRGTGNYVNVLLDSFELTQDLQYLTQAERVILSTISAQDDISKRNFEDIENSWFYVVLLQGVGKYLYIVSAMDELRPFKQPILQAFLRYSEYIKDHEAPYLTYKERLEYPNDTWTAQDLRKVQILSSAALLTDGEQRSGFIAKATELQAWIEQKLNSSDEKFYTRILVLMMQNYGSLQLLNTKHTSLKKSKETKGVSEPVKQKVTNANTEYDEKLAHSAISRVVSFIQQYSIGKERQHLVQRIPKLQKWLGKSK
ncbi:hypothetical protein [Glaciecola sp. SC05]|uniref:hypothetical protein n=1 Tax=Glaciecola sp. SC05 TaxID=1987355 RepID=UPI003528D7CA